MRKLKRICLFLPTFFFLSFSFPESHTFHKDFGLEWCYFVGTLESSSGGRFGYELSFFRAKWKNAEVFPVHFALSDLTLKKHTGYQTLLRNQGGLAGYNKTKIWSGEYSLEIISSNHFRIQAIPLHSKVQLNLELKTTSLPLIHGENGKSTKSRINPEIYSYYYSLPRLETKGEVSDTLGIKSTVTGVSWMDHEWSAQLSQKGNPGNAGFQLGAKDSGWDWIFLHLSDGSDLVAFQFRIDSKSESEAFATWREEKGKVFHFTKQGDVQFFAQEKPWKSSRSGKEYPLFWQIKIPNLTLNIKPEFMEQEFDGRSSTGQVYWEGVVKANGIKNGEPISGEGFLELKGR